MTLAEILNAVHYVVDEQGNRKAVQVDLTLWEELITLLEDLEDSEELARLRETVEKGEEEIISWDQAKAELQSEGVDV
jgi:hypothetical protein